jgi:hypothetical protein
MTGLVRKAVLFAACSVLIGASAAVAGTPYPGNSTVQWFNPATSTFITANRINLVDNNGSASDPSNSLDSIPKFAKIWITVKDISGIAVNASNVQLKFTGAYSDLKICTAQPYHAEIVDVPNRIVRNFTNSSGIVTFVVAGSGTWTAIGSPPPAHPAGSLAVWADTTPMFNIGCGTFDYDQVGPGVGAADLSRFAKDLFPPSPATQDRSDYDGSGLVTAGDLSIFAQALFPYAGYVHAQCAPGTLVP